jgi:hypothetical protein
VISRARRETDPVYRGEKSFVPINRGTPKFLIQVKKNCLTIILRFRQICSKIKHPKKIPLKILINSPLFPLAHPLPLIFSEKIEAVIEQWRSCMENRHVVDKRSIKLEDVLKKDYIPFLGGRPKRETIINKDDIMNLEITLNTCASVEEFLAKV